jgi:hypothetical protein
MGRELNIAHMLVALYSSRRILACIIVSEVVTCCANFLAKIKMP